MKHRHDVLTFAPSRLLTAIVTSAAVVAPFAQAQQAPAPADSSTQAQSSAEKDKVLAPVVVKANNAEAGSNFSPGVSSVGAKTLTPLRDIPQSVTVVNHAVMESQGVASLQEALRNVPGITIGGAEGGQIGNNINLRGFTARTDIYLDGMRDRGQYYRDTYYLDSVEVLKGPSSMLFGRGSTGGVINQVRKQPSLNGVNELTATVGSNGYLRSTADINQKLSDTSAARVEIMGQDTGNTRDVMKNKDYGVAPSLRFGIGTPTEITLSTLVEHNHDMPDYGLPAVNGHPANVSDNTFYGLRDDRTIQDVNITNARIEHKFSPNLTLRNQTQYGDYHTDARETAANNVGTLSGGVFTALPTATTGNYTALPLSQLYVKLASHDRVIDDRSFDNQTDVISKFDTGTIKHTLITGLEFGHDTYKNVAVTRNNLPIVPLIDPPYTDTPTGVTTTTGNVAQSYSTGYAAYFNDTLELNKQWKVVAGLRWDRFKAHTDNTISTSTPPLFSADQTVYFTSVRSGVIYQPTDAQSYYVSYGTSFNPSLEALTVTSGQQSVAPEKNRSYEAGGKWDVLDGKLSLTSAVFDIEKTNARSLVSTGVYQLDGDVRVTGLELGAAGHITRNWQIISGYTHLNPVVTKASAADGTQGNTLANTPRDSAALWSTYNLTQEWEIGGGFTYLSSRFASNTDVVTADGYTRWDATVAYHQPKYDVRLNVLNLTDKHYIDSLIPSDGGRSVPGSGRTELLTVAFRF